MMKTSNSLHLLCHISIHKNSKVSHLEEARKQHFMNISNWHQTLSFHEHFMNKDLAGDQALQLTMLEGLAQLQNCTTENNVLLNTNTNTNTNTKTNTNTNGVLSTCLRYHEDNHIDNYR